jgi:hypothetical protein
MNLIVIINYFSLEYLIQRINLWILQIHKLNQ